MDHLSWELVAYPSTSWQTGSDYFVLVEYKGKLCLWRLRRTQFLRLRDLAAEPWEPTAPGLEEIIERVLRPPDDLQHPSFQEIASRIIANQPSVRLARRQDRVGVDALRVTS